MASGVTPLTNFIKHHGNACCDWIPTSGQCVALHTLEIGEKHILTMLFKYSFKVCIQKLVIVELESFVGSLRCRVHCLLSGPLEHHQADISPQTILSNAEYWTLHERKESIINHIDIIMLVAISKIPSVQQRPLV